MNLKRNDKARPGALTKKVHIKYWVDTAKKDWIAVKRMLECRSYIHALFFMHLGLKKLLKAHWVKDNIGNFPPRAHNLIHIVNNTSLKINEIQLDLFKEINIFQLEGRYPDYKQNLFVKYKREKTYVIFASVKTIRKCLLKKLQSEK